MLLENETLRVQLHDGIPVVASYTHLATGQTLLGDPRQTPLTINGAAVAIGASSSLDHSATATSAAFHVTYGDISFDYGFDLEADCLRLRIDGIEGPLETLGFGGSPLLQVSDREYRYARISVSEPSENGKKWWREHFGSVGGDEAACDVIRGCVYHPDRLCAFVHGNFPLLPERHANGAAGYCGRSQRLPVPGALAHDVAARREGGVPRGLQRRRHHRLERLGALGQPYPAGRRRSVPLDHLLQDVPDHQERPGCSPPTRRWRRSSAPFTTSPTASRSSSTWSAGNTRATMTATRPSTRSIRGPAAGTACCAPSTSANAATARPSAITSTSTTPIPTAPTGTRRT